MRAKSGAYCAAYPLESKMGGQRQGNRGPDMSTADRVLAILAQVSGIDEVRKNLDLRLYDHGILDSMKTVELILAFSDQLGVDISPTEFDREEWATPRLITAAMTRRVGG